MKNIIHLLIVISISGCSIVTVDDAPKRYNWNAEDRNYECTTKMTYPAIDLISGITILTGSVIIGLSSGGIALAPALAGGAILTSGFIGKNEVEECRNFKDYKNGYTVDMIIQ